MEEMNSRWGKTDENRAELETGMGLRLGPRIQKRKGWGGFVFGWEEVGDNTSPSSI